MALKAASYVHRAAAVSTKSSRCERTERSPTAHACVSRKGVSCCASARRAAWCRPLSSRFGDVKRTETGGKGLDGVVEKAADYFNPFLELMESPR